jgi:hypothetical protein
MRSERDSGPFELATVNNEGWSCPVGDLPTNPFAYLEAYSIKAHLHLLVPIRNEDIERAVHLK